MSWLWKTTRRKCRWGRIDLRAGEAPAEPNPPKKHDSAEDSPANSPPDLTRQMTKTPNSVVRDVLANGSVRLSAGGCSFDYQRLKPGVMLVTIRGNDIGQFGPATVDELAAEFGRSTQALQLFVDTQGAIGPAREVMETWTEWFAANRSEIGAGHDSGFA